MTYELTPAQRERLAKLNEELGEAIQVIGKILLHGYHAEFDGIVYDNKSDLQREIGDGAAALQLMVDAGDLDPFEIDRFKQIKLPKITRYMKHQQD